MQAPIVVVYPYNTIAAYNSNGNRSSLYMGPDRQFSTRSRQVSFSRPTDQNLAFTQGFEAWHGSLPDSQRSLFRFISDQDMEDYSQLANAQVLVIIGHSEYWTRTARTNFDAFVDGGGNAAVLSGNTMYWQVRYTDDASGLICYKSLLEDQIADTSLATAEWDQDILNYKTISSIGANFSNGGFGNGNSSGWHGYRIVNPASPLLAGTGLRSGEIIHLETHEHDGAPIKGYNSSGAPIIDQDALGFYRTELIGYDFAQLRGHKTTPTFFAFQKSETSGVVVNTASTNWCCFNGMGAPGIDGGRIRKITENIIFGLLNGKPIFST